MMGFGTKSAAQAAIGCGGKGLTNSMVVEPAEIIFYTITGSMTELLQKLFSVLRIFVTVTIGLHY